MNSNFEHIQQKINGIQHGLLRFRDDKMQVSFLTRVVADTDGSLTCVIDEEPPMQKLLNRSVSLVQKRHYDFLYINGVVSGEATKSSKVLSVQVVKASWFVRKAKGNQSWFEAKHVFVQPKKTSRPREAVLSLK